MKRRGLLTVALLSSIGAGCGLSERRVTRSPSRGRSMSSDDPGQVLNELALAYSAHNLTGVDELLSCGFEHLNVVRTGHPACVSSRNEQLAQIADVLHTDGLEIDVHFEGPRSVDDLGGNLYQIRDTAATVFRRDDVVTSVRRSLEILVVRSENRVGWEIVRETLLPMLI